MRGPVDKPIKSMLARFFFVVNSFSSIFLEKSVERRWVADGMHRYSMPTGGLRRGLFTWGTSFFADLRAISFVKSSRTFLGRWG